MCKVWQCKVLLIFISRSANFLCDYLKSDFKKWANELQKIIWKPSLVQYSAYTSVKWKPEVSGGPRLRMDFTVKEEIFFVQQIKVWDEKYLHIHIFVWILFVCWGSLNIFFFLQSKLTCIFQWSGILSSNCIAQIFHMHQQYLWNMDNIKIKKNEKDL